MTWRVKHHTEIASSQDIYIAFVSRQFPATFKVETKKLRTLVFPFFNRPKYLQSDFPVQQNL